MKQNDIETAKATVVTLLSFADDECSNLHESAEYVIKTIDAQAERIKELEGVVIAAHKHLLNSPDCSYANADTIVLLDTALTPKVVA